VTTFREPAKTPIWQVSHLLNGLACHGHAPRFTARKNRENRIMKNVSISTDKEAHPALSEEAVDALRGILQADAAFPVLSDLRGDRLRISIRVGPVEAAFEEELEATFEPFLDPLVSAPRLEMAETLERIARQIREAELEARGARRDDPSP
jgi:hypothetical protein